MPELPEVETVRRSLLPLVGRRIERVDVMSADVIRSTTPETFSASIVGHTVSALDRRGKYLLVHLMPKATMLVHLRMTGRLRLVEAGLPVGPHTHVRMTLHPEGELRYDDSRRFGGFWLTGEGTEPKGFRRLGPEPLGDQFQPHVFRRHLSRRRGTIKAALLDQHLVAGIGNIYADEALFLAGVHPMRAANSLGRGEVTRLVAAVRQTLLQAVENHGTTILDFLDGRGEPGLNAEALRVYGRAGLACEGCGGVIEKMRLGGRGTHLCPVCQPLAPARRRRRGDGDGGL